MTKRQLKAPCKLQRAVRRNRGAAQVSAQIQNLQGDSQLPIQLIDKAQDRCQVVFEFAPSGDLSVAVRGSVYTARINYRTSGAAGLLSGATVAWTLVVNVAGLWDSGAAKYF